MGEQGAHRVHEKPVILKKKILGNNRGVARIFPVGGGEALGAIKC